MGAVAAHVKMSRKPRLAGADMSAMPYMSSRPVKPPSAGKLLMA